jgi:hypothetical protein
MIGGYSLKALSDNDFSILLIQNSGWIGLDSFSGSEDLDFLMKRSGLISRQRLVPPILNYDCIFSMQTRIGRELPANITFFKGFVAVIDRHDITGPLFSKSN